MLSSAPRAAHFAEVQRETVPQRVRPHALRAPHCAVLELVVLSDEELVERARRGDRAAFQALFLAHRSQTVRLLARLVPQNEI